MKKAKVPIKKKKSVKVSAWAKCEGFDINLSAEFFPHGLASHEITDVQRKLKQSLADAVSKLPFAFVYAHEVKVK